MTNWSLLKWFRTDGYRRLILVRTPWFQVALNFIDGVRDGLSYHDHPRSFFGLVLKGSYTEARGELIGDKLINTGYHFQDYYFLRRARDVHRIVSVEDMGAVTLTFHGPRRRPWSFFTPVGTKPVVGSDFSVIQTPYEL